VPARIDRLPVATSEKISDALAFAKGDGAPYSIVHISGHGMEGYLVLDDGFGCTCRTDARALGETFHNQGVGLVVLSACCSAGAAFCDQSVAEALVQAGVPAVIGMSQKIDDRVATKLTAALYKRLAAGLPVREALEEARKVICRDPAFQKYEGSWKPAHDAVVPVLFGKPDLMPALVPAEPGIFDNYPPGNLPRNASFFGRAQEIVRICHDLDQSGTRIIGISGIGGIGKSSLVCEAALRFSSHFEAMVYSEAKETVPLTLERILDDIRRILRLKPDADVLDTVNRTACLLVLDNLHWLREEDWPPIAEFIRKIDPAWTKVIVTSRAPWKGFAGINGFVEYHLDDLDRENSLNLLFTELREHGVTRYTNGDPRSAAELMQLTEICRCHPYLLQLAAARLAEQSFDQLCSELKDLKGEFQEWSDRFLAGQVKLLKPDGAVLFRQLSIFPSSFDRSVAMAICSEGIDADAELLNLVRFRLLRFLSEDERYQYHDLTRVYARKLLTDEKEFLVLGERHAEYFLQLFRYASELLNTDQAMNAVAAAEREYTNLIAGVSFFKTRKDWLNVIDYGVAVDRLLDRAGLWNERISILKDAVYAARKLEDKQAIFVLALSVGNAYIQQGDYDEARDYFNESLKISKESEDKAGVAESLLRLGSCSDYDEAIVCYNEALDISEELKDKSMIARCYHKLGMLAFQKNDYKSVKNYFNDFLKIAKELTDKDGIARKFLELVCLAYNRKDYGPAKEGIEKSLEMNNSPKDTDELSESIQLKGLLALRDEDFPSAATYYNECLEIAIASGNKAGIARSFLLLGIVAFQVKNYDSARLYFQASLHMSDALGYKEGIVKSLFLLGKLAYIQGDPDSAKKRFDDSLEIAIASGNLSYVSDCLDQLATLARERGDYESIRNYYEKKRETEDALDHKEEVTETLRQLGMLAQACGDNDRAQKYFKECRDVAEKTGNIPLVIECLFQLGVLAYGQHDDKSAKDYFIESLGQAKASGNKNRIPENLKLLGLLAYEQHDTRSANDYFTKSLGHARASGDKSGIAENLHWLGKLGMLANDDESAKRFFMEFLKLKEEMEDTDDVGTTLGLMASLEEKTGDYEKAFDLIVRAEKILVQINSPYAAIARETREGIEKKMNTP
jgi:tetratricopeptide (TPR) repeat protein